MHTNHMPDASGYNAACCVAELDRIGAECDADDRLQAEAYELAGERLTDPKALAEVFCDLFSRGDYASKTTALAEWIAACQAAGVLPAPIRDALRDELASLAEFELRKAEADAARFGGGP
jgi:hypothetical protein